MGGPICPQCARRCEFLSAECHGEPRTVDATFCDFCDRIWAAGGGVEAYWMSACRCGRVHADKTGGCDLPPKEGGV